MTPSPLTVALDRAIAFDRASARKSDANGWFEVKDNPISKVGVFPYLGRELPNAPDQNRMYRVYRPASELSSPEFLESLRLVPWINDHKVLGKKLGGVPAERYGVDGVTGQDSWFDGECVRSNIKIFSEAMAEDIAKGKCELSLGYQRKIDWTPGVFNGQQYDCVQRELRANHLALVDAGRMGPDVVVLDQSLDPFPIATDSLEYKTMSDNNKPELTLADVMTRLIAMDAKIADMEKKMPAEDSDEEKAAKLKAAEEADKAAKDKAAKDAEGKEDPKAAMDAAIKPLLDKISEQDKTIKALQDGQANAAKSVALDASIAAGLVDRLKPLVGVFDHSGMTAADVVAYGVEKLGLKPAAGNEAVALDSYLLGIAAAAPRATTIATDSKPKPGGVVDKYLNPASKE